MESRTTEELFEALSPEAREEAVRLAARLQDRGMEGRDLLDAAREAGIADAHLRAAAFQVGPGSLTVESEVAGVRVSPGVALAALLAATQALPAYFCYHESSLPLFLSTLWLSALLAGLLARRGRWWSGLAVTAAAWTLALALIHILTAGFSIWVPVHPSEAYALGTALRALLFAGIGTGIAFLLPVSARAWRTFAPTLG